MTNTINDGWRDGDTRHVFLQTARDRDRCHICLKSRHHIDHVSQGEYEQIKKAYQEKASGGTGT